MPHTRKTAADRRATSSSATVGCKAYGQESNDPAWRLAKTNLATRGLGGQDGLGTN